MEITFINGTVVADRIVIIFLKSETRFRSRFGLGKGDSKVLLKTKCGFESSEDWTIQRLRGFRRRKNRRWKEKRLCRCSSSSSYWEAALTVPDGHLDWSSREKKEDSLHTPSTTLPCVEKRDRDFCQIKSAKRKHTRLSGVPEGWWTAFASTWLVISLDKYHRGKKTSYRIRTMLSWQDNRLISEGHLRGKTWMPSTLNTTVSLWNRVDHGIGYTVLQWHWWSDFEYFCGRTQIVALQNKYFVSRQLVTFTVARYSCLTFR